MEKKSKLDKGELTNDQAIELLTEAVIAQVDQAREFAEDPFEQYVYGIQAKVFTSSNQLKARCLQGYRTLLHEIEKKQT